MQVVGNTFKDPDEFFNVNLLSANNATLTNNQVAGTIHSGPTATLPRSTPSTLSGFVFVDVNNNLTKDGSEKPLSGVTVSLIGTSSLSNSPVVKGATTAADGSYSFAGIDPGSYSIAFVQPSGYLAGTAILGSQGGALSNSTTMRVTIATPGGITGTNNDFATRGLAAGQISQRLFLASSIGSTANGGTSHVTNVSLTSVTDPITAANQSNLTASGTGEIGASVSVVASDGTHSTSAVMTTVGTAGTWTTSGIDASGLNDGTVTFTATATSQGATAVSTKTASKSTSSAAAVAITTVTDPVNSNNVTAASISGTGTVGASVSLVVTDGTHTTNAQVTTVSTAGTWSINNINLSSISDGTITYEVTLTDSSNNQSQATKTATKDTVAPSIALLTATNPVGSLFVSNATAHGTADAGITVSVVVTDGTHTTAAKTTTAGSDGLWNVTGLDLTSLNDGPITYLATVTDAAGNSATGTFPATKNVGTVSVALSSVTNPIYGKQRHGNFRQWHRRCWRHDLVGGQRRHPHDHRANDHRGGRRHLVDQQHRRQRAE